MNLQEASLLITCGTKPTLEDSVNIFCPHCAGEWYTHRASIHTLGIDNKTTVYNKFIGEENTLFKNGKMHYFCPKCKDTLGNRVELLRHDATANSTPLERWEYAELLLRESALLTELKRVQEQLRNYETLGGV